MFRPNRSQAASLECYQIELEGEIRRASKAWGVGGSDAIPPEMTLREWCEDLAAKGLKIDRKPFSLVDRPALISIYDAIPCTREEAAKRTPALTKMVTRHATHCRVNSIGRGPVGHSDLATSPPPAGGGFFVDEQLVRQAHTEGIAAPRGPRPNSGPECSSVSWL